MTPAEFADIYPCLYHMAAPNSWEGIRERGLLSTKALVDLFEISGAERIALVSEHRPESVNIEHPQYGTAVIRDQKPMSVNALAKCLCDMSPQQWFEKLNERVFFWPTEERVMNLLSARAYRGKAHCVLTVDTAELFRRHLDRISLSAINSGSTIYNPRPRGEQTFLPLDNYPYEARRKLRGKSNAVAEVAVLNRVPDVAEYTIEVRRLVGEKDGVHLVEQIHPR